MPGGRLSHQDRQQIASWLADGHGYAEIARRLGRPTSTISREVARNGGPGDYTADRAHRETGRRAQRHKPDPAAELPTPASAYGRDPQAVRDYIQRFAEMMIQTGLSRMASRVLAHLFTVDSGSLTAAELSHRLRVSPASVSKAIAYLENLELVRRERDPHSRRERYAIDDDFWLQAWSTSTNWTALWADAAQQGAEIFGPTTPAGARLDSMSQFFARLSDDMSAGPNIPPAADDALTVLAALAHARTPRTLDHLAAALGWPATRVTTALDIADQHPDITDPVALARPTPTTYTITARPHRLTAPQRAALRRTRVGASGT